MDDGRNEGMRQDIGMRRDMGESVNRSQTKLIPHADSSRHLPDVCMVVCRSLVFSLPFPSLPHNEIAFREMRALRDRNP